MKLALAVLGTSFVLAGCAAGPKEPDHAAHHPPGAAAAASAAPTPGQMDSMMKSMQEMHDRMMAAKTPEERGMGMGGGMRMSPEMMGKRMDMMEMMMKMMMDREATKPPAAK